MKRILIAASVLSCSLFASAQSGTNSPYSQFGLGTLAEQSSGFNRGMNGLGIGFREHDQVNFTNPASYSAIDSLTFLFDVGMSGQLTNFQEGGKKLNAKTANFEYAVAAFRAARHLGVSFGILPFTIVGYKYAATEFIGETKTSSYTNTYTGSGGIRQAYLGVGWQPFKGVAIGVNGGYLWGGYDRSMVNSYNAESTANTLSKYYSANVNSYKLDVGVQFTVRLSKKDELTLGATYGYGHKIGGNPSCLVISTNKQTQVADTTSYPLHGKLDLEIPTTFGAGVMFNHNNSLKIGADYQYQQWGKVKMPEYVTTNNVVDYSMSSNMMKDRHKVTLGFDLCPAENSRKFLDRVHYRAGVSYATPYLLINGHDGPKEMSASLGFGIPILNRNSLSTLNISGQWVRNDCKLFMTENVFRINIGLTFNERWFMKWKVE